MAKKKEQKAKNRIVKEDRDKIVKGNEVVNVKLQFPKRDWILFKFACENHGYKSQEVLRGLFVRWAEDLMKTELPPPG